MQKNTLAMMLASSVLVCGAANAASSFDGFYVGVGATSSVADSKITLSTGGSNPSYFLGEGSRQTGLNINLGYGKSFGKLYLAGEITYASNQGETATTSVVGNSVTKRANSVKSFSLLPGVMLNDNTLLYAKLAKGIVDIEETGLNPVFNVTLSSNTDVDVLTKGVGLEYKFGTNISFRGEFNVSNGENTSLYGTKHEISLTTLLAGVQYRF